MTISEIDIAFMLLFVKWSYSKTIFEIESSDAIVDFKSTIAVIEKRIFI